LKELEAVRYENKQLQQNIEEKDGRISNLTQTVIRLEGENQQQQTELQQLRQSNLSLKGESFEEELQSLKQSIVDFFAKYKEQSPGRHLENYYTIEALYEGKIDENVKLHQEVEDLKDFLNREQREKTRLIERIINL
jgi:predicted nuclease with TOPRIM domain